MATIGARVHRQHPQLLHVLHGLGVVLLQHIVGMLGVTGEVLDHQAIMHLELRDKQLQVCMRSWWT